MSTLTIIHEMSTQSGTDLTAQTGRIAIVSGANNGIGFETTVGMAEAGLHIVMACRSQAKADAAKAEVLARVASASLDIILLDLSDLASVRAFAKAFRARHTKLDVLINNAGILVYSPETNANGFELQFATNHLGHFLLTSLLIDMIPDDPTSRIISLSSLGHRGASIHFDDLSCGQDGGVAYGQSKLACLLFGDELDRSLRAAGKVMKSISVHPGGSETDLVNDMDEALRNALLARVGQHLHSHADAAKPTLFAAMSDDAVSGEYYGPTGFGEISGDTGIAIRDPICDDHDVAARLWRLSEDMTSQEFVV